MANHGIARAAIEALREKDKRRNARHAIELKGRIKFADGREDICCTVNASSGGLELRCSNPGAIGSRVTCQIEEIGWVDGEIRRLTEQGVGLEFVGSQERIARIAGRIEWLVRHHLDPSVENRASARIVPTKTSVSIHCGIERSQARIIDVSLSGVAIASSQRPETGASVTVGMRRAKVVRHIPDGFAAQFNLPLSMAQFDASIVL